MAKKDEKVTFVDRITLIFVSFILTISVALFAYFIFFFGILLSVLLEVEDV